MFFLNNKDNKENEEYLKDLLKQPTCRVDFFYCFDHSSFRSGNNHTLLACYLLYGIYTFPQHRPKDFYLTEGGHDDRPTDHTAQTSPWKNTEKKKKQPPSPGESNPSHCITVQHVRPLATFATLTDLNGRSILPTPKIKTVEITGTTINRVN